FYDSDNDILAMNTINWLAPSIPDSLNVTSPNSSSSWETGTTHSITWISEGSITNVKIELFKDGVFVLEITSNTTNDGDFSWTIPAGLDDSTQYQINISDVSNPDTYNLSEYFEIYTPNSITVTSPDSSSSWEAETTHSVTWTSTGSITNVKIELYKDGVFVLEIVASTGNDGDFSWTIPAGLDNSTQYQVNISDVSNPDTYDLSDNFEIFTIPEEDSLTVTNPSTATAWEMGSSHAITWTSTGSITTVKIELYKAGVFVLEIIASTANDGSYTWAIPTDLEDGIDYQIKISDVSNPATYDESPNFAITSIDIPEDGDGIIPSYNLYIIIGIISVVSVILVKNRKKIKSK
ncbi:MAG: Ser-Thr-rich GPI-anchored membrane family protein, partial [Promethearchaeota archaeon]